MSAMRSMRALRAISISLNGTEGLLEAVANGHCAGAAGRLPPVKAWMPELGRADQKR
jgi:hypothetical protein